MGSCSHALGYSECPKMNWADKEKCLLTNLCDLIQCIKPRHYKNLIDTTSVKLMRKINRVSGDLQSFSKGVI